MIFIVFSSFAPLWSLPNQQHYTVLFPEVVGLCCKVFKSFLRFCSHSSKELDWRSLFWCWMGHGSFLWRMSWLSMGSYLSSLFPEPWDNSLCLTWLSLWCWWGKPSLMRRILDCHANPCLTFQTMLTCLCKCLYLFWVLAVLASACVLYYGFLHFLYPLDFARIICPETSVYSICFLI